MDPSHEATSAEPITGPFVAAVFDHTAHAAPSIRTLLRVYQDLLGSVSVGGGDNTRVGYRVVHLQFDNGSKIELMEPLDGSTFFDSFFARMPHGGLHHVTFRVPDIRAAIVRMQQLGFRPTAVYLDDEVPIFWNARVTAERWKMSCGAVEPAYGGNESPMFQRILIPVDGSRHADQALPLAIRLAQVTGGPLRLVRSVDRSGQDGDGAAASLREQEVGSPAATPSDQEAARST